MGSAFGMDNMTYFNAAPRLLPLVNLANAG